MAVHQVTFTDYTANDITDPAEIKAYLESQGQEYNENITAIHQITFIAVSYTHLDVYKRQDGDFVDEHTLTTIISRIRKKIETDERKYIKTAYGMGYQWIGGEPR